LLKRHVPSSHEKDRADSENHPMGVVLHGDGCVSELELIGSRDQRACGSAARGIELEAGT
jgi:hypothetical protein